MLIALYYKSIFSVVVSFLPFQLLVILRRRLMLNISSGSYISKGSKVSFIEKKNVLKKITYNCLKSKRAYDVIIIFSFI